MTTFDKREQGFEAKFAHDEELRFKSAARSAKLFGNWAAALLGLSGDAAAGYATALVTGSLESQNVDGMLQKVAGDLATKGISPEEVARKLNECQLLALQQIEAEI